MSVVTAFYSVAVSLSTVAVVGPPPETSSAGPALVPPHTGEGLSDGTLGVIVVFSVLFLILGPSFLYLWHHRRNRDYWFYSFRRRRWPSTSSTYSHDSHGSSDYEKGVAPTRPRPPNDFPPHVSFKSEVEMKSAILDSSDLTEEIASGSSKTKPTRNHTTTSVEEDFSIHSIRPVQSPSRDRPPQNHDHSSRYARQRSFTRTNLSAVKSPSRDRPPPIREEPIRPYKRQRSFSLSNLHPVNHPSRARSSRGPHNRRDREEVPQTSLSISKLPPAPHRSISRRNTSPRSVNNNRVGASSDSELEYYHSRTNRTVPGRKESESVPVIVAEYSRGKDKNPSQESYYSSSGFSLSTLEPAEPSRRQRSPLRYVSTTSRHARVKDADSDSWSISSIGTAPRPSRRSQRASRTLA